MNEETRRVRVTASRARDHIDDVTFRRGDHIAVGHRNQQYPAFVWGATEDGKAGWVPEAFLEMTGTSQAVGARDYDGAQLTVAKGETLEVLYGVEDWLFCRNATGVEGWVPAVAVEEAAA